MRPMGRFRAPEGGLTPVLVGPVRSQVVMRFPVPAEYDQAIAELLSNEKAMHHLIFMARQDSGGWTAADAQERRERQEQEFQRCTSMNGIIVHNGQFAGIAGFRDIAWWNGSCEMGIILHPSFWGKQLCVESHLICLSYAFEVLGLNRIEFRTAISNASMVGFLNRFGASREGTLRDYFPVDAAGFVDVALFSILARDWAVVKEALIFHLNAHDVTLVE